MRGFGRAAFGGHRLGAARAILGQTPYEWYVRAKNALSQFERLLLRLDAVANQKAREDILSWVGEPTTEGTPAYRYARVLGDIQQDVESYTPPNYGAYSLERRQGRVEELEGFVEDLQDKVAAAEKTYGTLPRPQAPSAPAPAAAGAVTADLTVPIIAAGAAVALAVLLS